MILVGSVTLSCRFEHVSCSVPGSRFNTAHWASVAHRRKPPGKPPGHGRPLNNGHDVNGHDKSIAVRFFALFQRMQEYGLVTSDVVFFCNSFLCLLFGTLPLVQNT